MCKGLFTIYVDKTDRQHPYTVLRVERITFFRVNLVENQNEPKRPVEKKWSAQRGELFRGADDQFCLRRQWTAPYVYGLIWEKLIYGARQW